MPRLSVKASAISSDWRRESAEYKVVSVYRRTLNAKDEHGRRCTLITDYEDFSTRTALVEEIPPLSCGDFFSVTANGAPELYEPLLLAGHLLPRWTPFIAEWKNFMFDDDLSVLANAWKKRDWTALIGLGPGLTPAGDDFIHGRLSAHLRAHPDGDEAVMEFKSAYARGSTTDLAESFYEDLMQRRIWRRGKLLIEALGTNDSQAIVQAVESVIRWGHFEVRRPPRAVQVMQYHFPVHSSSRRKWR